MGVSLASRNATPESIDLTVLILTRNEEGRIAACIESAMAAVERAKRTGLLRGVEYLLVDSASTDRTVQIASRYPVDVIRLDPSWPLSAGAGSYAGLLVARGARTAIVNGDMIIEERWFVEALPRLQGDVAAVTGIAKEDLSGRSPIERLVVRYSYAPLSEGAIPPDVASHTRGYSTGTMLLRTAEVKAAGSIHPFLRAAEDYDLRYRLMRAGWRVLDLPVVQGTHFWAEPDGLLELLHYFRTILRNSIGLGQMARVHLRRDMWLAKAASRPCFGGRALLNGLVALGMTILASLHVIGTLVSLPVLLVALGADVAIAASTTLRAKRGRVSPGDGLFADLLYPLAFTTVRTLGFLRGFVARPRSPEDYPRLSARIDAA